MPSIKKSKPRYQPLVNILLIVAIIVVGIFYAGLIYFDQVHKKPENVFWGMMSQNLQTGALSRSNEQIVPGQSLKQVTQMQFKSQIIVKNSVVLTSEKDGEKQVIANEAIGTENADFLRYTAIPANNGKLPENVINVWSIQTEENSGQNPSILADNILSTPLMFGYLNSAKRSEIINELKNTNAITVDYSKTDLNAKFEDKTVYSFEVMLNLDSYINAYKIYLKAIGQSQLADELGSPDPGSTYPLTIFVNPVSYQPVKVEVGASSEVMYNFNINNQIQIPENVTTTITEIKNRISE